MNKIFQHTDNLGTIYYSMSPTLKSLDEEEIKLFSGNPQLLILVNKEGYTNNYITIPPYLIEIRIIDSGDKCFIWRYDCNTEKDFNGILPKLMIWYNTVNFTELNEWEFFNTLPQHLPIRSKIKRLY